MKRKGDCKDNLDVWCNKHALLLAETVNIKLVY